MAKNADDDSFMPCERKQSLFREWQEAFENYSKAVGELSDKMGLPESEYSKLKSKAASS